MIGQKQARIADFLKVLDNELSTTFHTMFVTSPFLGAYRYNVKIGWMLEGMDVMFFTFLMTSIQAKFFCTYFN
jgi:hypothetical protein